MSQPCRAYLDIETTGLSEYRDEITVVEDRGMNDSPAGWPTSNSILANLEFWSIIT